MSRWVMGISALYHDSAATLLRDGQIVAAASEERFSRVKHDAALPVRSVNWCLEHAGIGIEDLEQLVYYEKPLQKFERLVVSQVKHFPRSLKAFRRMALTWLTEKLWVRNGLINALGIAPERILFSDHHLSHAASAFYCSPFDEAAILTVDGVGEWASTTLFRGGPDGIERLSTLRFPHSIGLVYSAFTAYLGFRVNNGEYKVMGMAAYGEPRFEEQVLKILRPQEDGSFDVDTRYVSYHYSATDSFNQRFEDLFGPARPPGSPFDPTDGGEGRRYADVAASIQKVTEDCLVGLANRLHEMTGSPNLCLAGGVALNSVANREVILRSPFEHLFVQPAAGDAGGSMGAALWAWHEIMGQPREPSTLRPNLGREWSDKEIEEILADLRIDAEKLEGDQLVQRAAEDIAQGRIVGWCQGRFEWGPRALGHRSILANPMAEGMKDK
ncbi:MAG: carbamoyltransferase N-terminal domain-containing protein, partial [Myxococcota bacterium]|nr:carbamoyltransferase N-terminal domain-containing protein [Myxococcota bacterium]